MIFFKFTPLINQVSKKKKYDEYLNWLKKYAHVVNNRVLIDLIYTFLHIV